MPAPPSPAAQWRQQAIRVVRSTPGPAMSALDPGTVRLVREESFAQHGVLGQPRALVVSLMILNEGSAVAPLESVRVTFEVPGVTFDDTGKAHAGWLSQTPGWTFEALRIDTDAAVTLSYDGAIEAQGSTEVVLGLGLTSDTAPSRLEIRAHGRATGNRPALSSSLVLPVLYAAD
ncbi:hypothetical protein [Demequina sp.]|uniref:hypothetical protein n=1 Tax=Demequina sp. TaxID=2050685 RepID=UPI003A86FEA7